MRQNIQVEEIDTATASALETLRAKKGDCTEHAALFCALARAAGFPAREARGIAFRGGGFGGHAWNEVYLGGRWVPVDATIDFVGLPAGSVLFETCDGKSAKALSVAAWLALKSKADVQVASVTRRGETFDPRSEKETVVVTEKDLRDRANDITVDLRGGMKVLQNGSPIVVLSPTRHTLVVASVASAMASDEDWNTFVKELFGGMGAPVPAGVKPERQSIGGKAIYRATFPEVATPVPLGVEVRVVSSRGFSVATVVAAQKDIFGAGPLRFFGT